MPHKLCLITDTSPATVDALVDSYASSFGVDSFYPATAQFLDIPDGEQWHKLQLKQTVYQSLTNPRHEVWAILEGEGQASASETGALGIRNVAALYILKLPDCPWVVCAF